MFEFKYFRNLVQLKLYILFHAYKDSLKMNIKVNQQEDMSTLKEKQDAPARMLEVEKEIQSADGFVIILSECNCNGIPSALKILMEHFASPSYRHRPCSVVAYSKNYKS